MRQYHPLHLIIPNSATPAYLLEWNHLPTEIIEQENLDLFTDELSYYYIALFNSFNFFFLGKLAELPVQ